MCAFKLDFFYTFKIVNLNLEKKNYFSGRRSNYNGFVICHTYSLLETFAAVARRRTSGASSSAASTNANNSRNTANSLSSGVFGRGLSTNSVSSLVRLALSSNFPSGLLNQVYSGTYKTVECEDDI